VADLLGGWPSGRLACWLDGWLADSMARWLAGQAAGWLAGWLKRPAHIAMHFEWSSNQFGYGNSMLF